MVSPFLPDGSGFDFQKQANRLGISIWRTPAFLSLMLGVFTLFLMGGVYFIFSSGGGGDMEILFLVEAGIAITMLLLGGFMIHLLEEMAITDKLKSDFILNTSHKLKSPLARIKWHIDLFREKSGSDEKNRESLEVLKKIETANDHLMRMVDEFLNTARIDSGGIRLYREKIDVFLLLRKIYTKRRLSAEEKGVHFRIEPFHGKGEVYGDGRKMEMVIDNLVLNAIHYTERSGLVTVRAVDRGRLLEVCVEDDGIGIPIEYQPYIFEKFFRADNAVLLNGEGSGLGLYLCQRIMKQMGGKIWFQSKEKEGSTFCAAFPRGE